MSEKIIDINDCLVNAKSWLSDCEDHIVEMIAGETKGKYFDIAVRVSQTKDRISILLSEIEDDVLASMNPQPRNDVSKEGERG